MAAGACTSRTTRPKFAYNFMGNVTTIASDEHLPAGPVTVACDFAYDGGGLGKGGTGTLSVNGKKVATGRIERTTPLIFGVETSDVGMNLYTTVTDDYAKGDNAFTGTIKAGADRCDRSRRSCAGHTLIPNSSIINVVDRE